MTPEPPFIVALCPTFRHPEQLANSLHLWNQQTYPAHRRHLVILDDAGTFCEQHGPNWSLYADAQRAPTLPAKYNRLLELGRHPRSLPHNQQVDAYAVWEDDDIYLPGYLAAHASVLQTCELSKPTRIWTDYKKGEVIEESGAGRFHSSLAFRADLIHRVGGWPPTKRADFDLQTIALLTKHAVTQGDPGLGHYVYAWHTGGAHGQWCMSGPNDESWYDDAARVYKPVPYVGLLNPRQNACTANVLEILSQGQPQPVQ